MKITVELVHVPSELDNKKEFPHIVDYAKAEDTETISLFSSGYAKWLAVDKPVTKSVTSDELIQVSGNPIAINLFPYCLQAKSPAAFSFSLLVFVTAVMLAFEGMGNIHILIGNRIDNVSEEASVVWLGFGSKQG